MDEEQKEVEVKRYREIRIVPGIVGWKVIIGCSEFYVSSYEDVMDGLRRYFEDPSKAESYYMRKDQRLRRAPETDPVPVPDRGILGLQQS